MAENEITGLVITGKVVEWATVQRTKDGFRVVASGRTEYEQAKDGTTPISEPATDTEDTPESRLKKALAGLKGLVTVGVQSEQLILRTINLPPVDDDELASMVQLQMDKFSPFPLETMVVSHEVLERRAESHRVLIAGAKLETIEELGKALRSGGVDALRVDAAILGRWRSLQDVGYSAHKGREIVVLLTESHPELMVLQDGIPIVFRSLSDSEGISEAEFAEDTVMTLTQTLMSLELEHGFAGECHVSVWHSGKTPELLAAKLRDCCQCEVALKSIESLPSVSEGLARRAMEQAAAGLDLTPPVWRQAEQARLFKTRMLATIAAVVGLWAVFMIAVFGGLYVENLSLERLKAKKAELDKSAREVRNTKERVVMIGRYMDRSKSSLECLREISLLQPQGVDLTSLAYRKDEDVKLSGEADSANLVYDFKNKLDGSGFFKSSTLDGPRRDPRRSKEIFDMDLMLSGGVK